MLIERHIYGSVTGYQTLGSSPGLKATEIRALESISLGQTSDPSFLPSLAASPGYVVRALRQRMALTRVTPGPPDDHGRATVRRISAVISRDDWDGTLRGDLLPLLSQRELWEWDGQAQPRAVTMTFPEVPPANANAATARKLLDLVSLLERNLPLGKPVVVRETSFSIEEFRLLHLLLPPPARGSHAAVYRAVRADLPASLIVLAEQAPVPASAETYRPGQAVQPSPYAQALAAAGFGSGRRPGEAAPIPFECANSYRSFGMPSRSSLPRAPAAPGVELPPQVIVERMPRGVLTVLIAACILLPIIASLVTYIWTVHLFRNRISGLLGNAMSISLPIFDADSRTKLLDVCNGMKSSLGHRGISFENSLSGTKARSIEMDALEEKLANIRYADESRPSEQLRNSIPEHLRNAYTRPISLLQAAETKLKEKSDKNSIIQEGKAEEDITTARQNVIKGLVSRLNKTIPDTVLSGPQLIDGGQAISISAAMLEVVNSRGIELGCDMTKDPLPVEALRKRGESTRNAEKELVVRAAELASTCQSKPAMASTQALTQTLAVWPADSASRQVTESFSAVADHLKSIAANQTRKESQERDAKIVADKNRQVALRLKACRDLILTPVAAPPPRGPQSTIQAAAGPIDLYLHAEEVDLLRNLHTGIEYLQSTPDYLQVSPPAAAPDFEKLRKQIELWRRSPAFHQLAAGWPAGRDPAPGKIVDDAIQSCASLKPSAPRLRERQ